MKSFEFRYFIKPRRRRRRCGMRRLLCVCSTVGPSVRLCLRFKTASGVFGFCPLEPRIPSPSPPRRGARGRHAGRPAGCCLQCLAVSRPRQPPAALGAARTADARDLRRSADACTYARRGANPLGVGRGECLLGGASLAARSPWRHGHTSFAPRKYAERRELCAFSRRKARKRPWPGRGRGLGGAAAPGLRA